MEKIQKLLYEFSGIFKKEVLKQRITDANVIIDQKYEGKLIVVNNE